MTRAIFAVSSMFGAASFLLLDSAFKAAALLMLATVAAVLLRRQSAATRHLVWLLAMVALLVVPALSAILPQWRVLPDWAGISPPVVVVERNARSVATPARDAPGLPAFADPAKVEHPTGVATPSESVAELPDPRPALVIPQDIPQSSAENVNWIQALPLVWFVGFSLFILRLLAARWMLWNSASRGTVIWPKKLAANGQPANATHDPIVAALESVCLQLGIRRPVTLLIHPDKSIPVVWGIVRRCLWLPTAARTWSDEQLRSVLLHELAHIKRCDPLAQLLSQIACAVHWFNPLVWFAAWRLGVERERACDDLVLTSGVRPSAYAGHLLEVVTGHSTARWTHSSGLAMARKSSLEGRLVAVLRKNVNRRSVPAVLAAIALAIAVGIAVPIAMLRAGDEKPKAPTQKQKSQSPTASEATKPPGNRDIVFITRGTKRPLPKIAAGDGVTLEINEHVFHGADVITKVRIRYTAADGTRTGHDVDIAMDAFGNRAMWALAWVRGTKTFWHVNGEFDGRYLRLYRTVFDDPQRIVTDYDANYPGEPLDGLGIPDELRAKFEQHFGITNPKVMDERGRLPEVGGRFIHAAQPVNDSGDVPQQPKSATPATTDTKPKVGAKLTPGTEDKLEWGEPANGLRMALCWPPVLDEPAAGDAPDLHLAVQNVSEAPVRFCTTAEATVQRRLTHKSKGTIQFRIVDDKPAGVDCTLRPNETVFLRLFAPDDKPGAVPWSSEIASGVRRMPDYSLVAEMEIFKGPAGAWTGKLTTPATRAGVGADAPKNRKAQELFKVWLQHTRVNGRIPGGLIARVGERVREFVKANAADKAGAPFAKRMAPLVPRLDGTRDWQPAEAAALLSDIAAVSDAPLSVALEEIAAGKIQHGLRLEKELEDTPWGEPLANGLRMACIIGPGVMPRLHYVDWVGNVVTRGGTPPDKAGAGPATVAARSEIRLGTPLGCRILIHNAGKAPVVFRTRSWHHIEPTAKDAREVELGVESVTRFTRAPLVTWRLEPGRYIELPGPGFGLGKHGFHDFGSADIASWIDAKAGDEVTLTPGLLPLFDWNESPTPTGEPRWWLDFITARLSLATPLPTDAAERAALLRQAMADLFRQDVRPTDEETAAFVNDTSPQALTNVAERIFHRPGLHAWAGPLQSAPTKFRVTAADQRDAKPADAPAATLPPADKVAPENGQAR